MNIACCIIRVIGSGTAQNACIARVRDDRPSALLGYTNGMKTAVSVPDAIFERAEKLARRMRKSRSQLYSDALREYAARHDPATVTAALDALYEGEDSGPDVFVRESGRRTLRSTDW